MSNEINLYRMRLVIRGALDYYSVFHIDQCDGIRAKHIKSLQQHAQPDETAEQIILSLHKQTILGPKIPLI